MKIDAAPGAARARPRRHPQPIRAALHLKVGDTIAYAIAGEKVILSRAPTQPVDDPLAKFDESSSEADRRAYADL